MNIRTAAKTPYEIRLDLLILAKEILMAKHAADSASKFQAGGWSPTDSLIITTSPTSDEIIKEADKLNGFVSQTTHQH